VVVGDGVSVGVESDDSVVDFPDVVPEKLVKADVVVTSENR
jgi:hypothetical protein